MKLTDLFESAPIDVSGNMRSRESFDRMAAGAPKHASFCFGRLNPPTLGHAALLDKTAESAMNGEYYIFVSKTHDKKDNPLDYHTKLHFLNEMFPQYAQHIVVDESIKTPLLAADWLYNKGIRAMTMVAGSDRLEQYKTLMEKWNSPEIREKYNRDECHINFVSSGEREDGAEGVAGISASAARAAAKVGDLEDFQSKTGTTGELAKKLFNAVREGMAVPAKLKESAGEVVKLGDLTDMKIGMQDADFWIEYRGSAKTVGTPSKQYGPHKLGIKVTATDRLDPKFLFYVFQHLQQQGKFAQIAAGTTNLVNLRVRDLANIPLRSN